MSFTQAGKFDPSLGSSKLGLALTLVLDKSAQSLMLFQSSAESPLMSIENVVQDAAEEREAIAFYRVGGTRCCSTIFTQLNCRQF